MSEFKIEKGVPRPGAGRGQYPLNEMDVGDSFFIPNPTNTALGGFFVAHKPKKFSIRSLEENGVRGIRVWRVK